jgi:hypothetical protein
VRSLAPNTSNSITAATIARKIISRLPGRHDCVAMLAPSIILIRSRALFFYIDQFAIGIPY